MIIPWYYRAVGAVALVSALVAGYFAWADHIGNVREAKVRAEYAAQAAKVDAERAAVSAPIVAQHQETVIKIQTVYRTITKEVPVYVKVTDCPMPGGFRVLHDAAANGQVPDAARIPDAAPVAAKDVASTVSENYGTCRETSQRLTDLQAWVTAQESLK